MKGIKNKFGYIYKITNTINGKIYIGKTEETVEQRFYEHTIAVKTGKKQSKLYSAMKHYGIENFTVAELDSADSREELCNKEKYWIKKLDVRNPDIGYNVSTGGDGGYTWSSKGCKWMTKDGEYRSIKPYEIDNYLAAGWVFGTDKSKFAHTTGKHVYNNGIKEVFAFECPEGFIKGPLRKGKHFQTAESKAKISAKSHNSKWYTNGETQVFREECPLGFRPGQLKWVTDGLAQFQVKDSELDYYIKLGFRRGKSNKKAGVMQYEVNQNKN